ncbi:RAD17 [Candida oxycetoniae]|uniref:RAD17 n=1 Tax=Candida oxycetoniae TaxID=497107 RepID=A0AAI9SVF5_9ASCO|nr:RAD17 [Candida oxycetoniae]KAI3403410.2 RAD17 [Candida oxycetoniae]
MSLFVHSSEEDDGPSSNPSIHRKLLHSKNKPTTTTTPPKKNLTFTASTTQISHLSDVFQSLLSVNKQTIIIIKPVGISLHSTCNYTTNVHVNIDPSLFSIFNISQEEEEEGEGEDADYTEDTEKEEHAEQEELQLRLGVDIGLIADCFTSVMNTIRFESAVTCYLTYNGEGHPLVIEFEDNYISEKLEFYTFFLDNEDTMGILDNASQIDYENVVMEVLVKSDVLTNLLQDLHQIGTETLFVYCAKNVLNFISSGPIGVSKLIFPNEKTIMEKLDINSAYQYVLSQFNFNDFNKILKSVKLSSRCKIIKDFQGLFSIQLLCKNHQQSGYSGTLITIHLTEMMHDELMIKSIIEEEQNQIEQIQAVTRRKLGLGLGLAPALAPAPAPPAPAPAPAPPALAPIVANLTHGSWNGNLINSFKKTKSFEKSVKRNGSTSAHNNNNNNNDDDDDDDAAVVKRHKNEVSEKKSSKSAQLPLFL